MDFEEFQKKNPNIMKSAYDYRLSQLQGNLQASDDEIESEFQKLLSYDVPLDEAVEAVRKKFPYEHTVPDWDMAFDDYSGEYPPPAVDESKWIEFSTMTGTTQLLEIGEDLQDTYNHAVYVLLCSIRGESLRDAEMNAKERLNEIPGWIHPAFAAGEVFYVGQSANLGQRLKTHAVGRMRERIPPAQITRISKILAVGLIAGTSNKEAAEEIEELYAENFKTVTEDDESVFVYSN